MTSIEEAIRSGAVRLVPVEATNDMTAAWPSYNKGAGHERSIYNAMLSASPDHTPALVALIEERDRLKVERDAQHPDDLAVDRFAAAMKAKLAKKRAEGRGGWEDKIECPNDLLSGLLREHVIKGDPVDVGNLAMMIHQRGERIG